MAEDRPADEALGELLARLEHLESLLQANTARLYAVERRLGLAESSSAIGTEAAEHQARPREEPAEREEAERADEWQTAEQGEEWSRAGSSDGRFGKGWVGGGGAAASSANRKAESDNGGAVAPAQAPRDFESIVGGSWFNWAGILAVAFGMAFFLKLAFENDWIGPGTRVSLGGAAGLGLLALAERLRGRGLRQYAYVLAGGGLLILYLSIYAAYNFYQLVGQPLAFVMMGSVTTAAVLLSVRLNALPVAVLGLVGGFLTPVLLSTGRDNQVSLFVYVALLDAGVLAVAYFKRWKLLNFLSFAATAVMMLGWLVAHYNAEKLWTTLCFLSLFFLIYAALAVVHNLLPRRRARWADVMLVGANASFHFSVAYVLLIEAGYERRLPATLAVIVSALFVLLFYAAWRLHREERLLAYVYVAGAVTFFTIALGTQYELYWVTTAWAIEALMLTWVGLRAGEPSARRAGLAVFALAALHWFGWDLPDSSFRAGELFVPLLNLRALSCASLIAALGGAAWLYRGAARRGTVKSEEAADADSALGLTAAALGLTLLTFDLDDYFARRDELARAGGATHALDRVENARGFSLTALWTLYGAGLLTFGVRLRRRALRYAGLLLLVVATLIGVAECLPFYAAAWHTPVLNPTFAAFALLVAAYFYVARLYGRTEGLPEGERAIVPLLVVAANLLAVLALSAEASGYFEARIAEAAPADSEQAPRSVGDLYLAKQLSLSLIWALYGAGLLVVGRVRRVRLLRLLALGLLGLTTLKVFFWDLASLDRVYRIVSFVVLGLILLAVSYFYQKSQQRAGGEETSQ
jgi:uncharacterized membrane protein